VTSAAPASTAAAPTAAPSVTIVPCLSDAHRRHEASLLGAGRCLPLPHRTAWLEAVGAGRGLFCAAEDPAGRCVAGFAIDVAPSRALPGHRLLRVERYVPGGGDASERATLGALRDLAAGDARILRVAVELHGRDADARRGTEALLAELGFRRAASARRYEHTLALDLAADEDAIFASFHRSARRNVREVAKHPVEVRAVDAPAWGARLQELLEGSMKRTGGSAPRHDWAARIALGSRHPELSRLAGLFRTDAEGPEALLAFVWGCHHGEYAHYDAAGAARTEGRLPVNYALLWDLVRWAKRGGARWLDLGGVTFGHLADGEDALGGISDFKRYFTRDVVEVGGEWLLEPRPLRAGLARALGAAVRRVRGLRG
jgi:hypothetical protein